MARINFDHLATTPARPEVVAAMLPFFTDACGNPSSLHAAGLKTRQALDRARDQFRALMGAPRGDDVIFTSGGTEAANLAVQGAALAGERRGRHLVVSAVEHPAVLQSVAFLEARGFTCTRVPVDGEGRVHPEAVRSVLSDATTLIAVQHANHDLGTIQPVAEIGRIAAERGIPFFVDATASGGWSPVDVSALGATLLSLSPHRFYGPPGVGVLYRSRRARLMRLQQGGGQEGGLRAGTENVPGIVGAGVAAELAMREGPDRLSHTADLQRRLWEGLRSRIPFLRLNGPMPGPGRLGTSLNVCVEFTEGEALALRCDLNGIAVAAGAACLGGGVRIPPVLQAIGLNPALARSAILLSLGATNTAAEVDRFLELFADKVVAPLRAMSPAWEDFQRGRIRSSLAGGG